MFKELLDDCRRDDGYLPFQSNGRVCKTRPLQYVHKSTTTFQMRLWHSDQMNDDCVRKLAFSNDERCLRSCVTNLGDVTI